MRRHLYLQLYLTLIAITIGCLVAAAIAFRVMHEASEPPRRYLGKATRLMMRALPAPHDPGFRDRLTELANEMDVDIMVLGPGGRPRMVIGKGPFPPPDRLRPGFFHGRGGPGFVVDLKSGARVVVRDRSPWHAGNITFFVVLAVVATVMAVGAYPMARRITRRLEGLERGVRLWGRGELSHRVPIEGNDEVAALAGSFNRAAEQIEALVTQQKQVLANASHELRSPLARLRMALELLGDENDPERRQRLIDNANQDIVDLDELVEELLVSARADARLPRRPFTQVALLELVRAEASRVGAAVAGSTISMAGEAQMLRHMLRNLLENADIHAGGQGVQITLEPLRMQSGRDGVRIAVEDRGPGVSESERERIFDPFYKPASSAAPPAEGRARRRPGAGLGLSLVRQVARYHSGEARCLPRAGGGSRFEVDLPLAVAS